MTTIETLTDVAGRIRTTYTDGADYYLGQPIASVDEVAGGWSTTLGWREAHGWTASIEFVVSSGRFYKTRAGAERAAAAHVAKLARKAA